MAGWRCSPSRRCGADSSGSIGMLIAARAVGPGTSGAALLTPQTLSTITRIFPPERRGGAEHGGRPPGWPPWSNSLRRWRWWTASAGRDLFVNVPIGDLIGAGRAADPGSGRPIRTAFDPLVLLSGGSVPHRLRLQESQTQDWPTRDPTIGAGLVLMAVFVYCKQSVNKNETADPASDLRRPGLQPVNVGYRG